MLNGIDKYILQGGFICYIILFEIWLLIGGFMKKHRFYTELSFLAAMLIMPVAVEFVKYADFGMSMVVAPAYLVSVNVPFLSFGQAEYCLQALLILAMCIVLRKFKLTYLCSFLTAFIYGNILDGIDLFMRYLPTDSIWLRVLYFAVGELLTAVSVSLFFHTYFTPQAYDFFVREISSNFSFNITKVKLIYDWSSFAVSVVLCVVTYFLTSQVQGVGVGTLICAAINGFLIGAVSKFLEKHFDFKDGLKCRKFFE